MNTLPAVNLTGTDLGLPAIKGRTSHTRDRVEITAGGRDFWGHGDEGHFAFTRVSGDFALSVRIVSLTMSDLYTKAGLMLRASLEPDAEHAFLLAFGDNQARNRNNGGLEFQYRESPGAACVALYPPQPLPKLPDFPASYPDLWLKLIRRGDRVTAQASGDSRHWRTYCEHRQHLPEAAFLGLAVTSHHSERAVQACFTHLSLTGNGA